MISFTLFGNPLFIIILNSPMNMLLFINIVHLANSSFFREILSQNSFEKEKCAVDFYFSGNNKGYLDNIYQCLANYYTKYHSYYVDAKPILQDLLSIKLNQNNIIYILDFYKTNYASIFNKLMFPTDTIFPFIANESNEIIENYFLNYKDNSVVRVILNQIKFIINEKKNLEEQSVNIHESFYRINIDYNISLTTFYDIFNDLVHKIYAFQNELKLFHRHISKLISYIKYFRFFLFSGEFKQNIKINSVVSLKKSMDSMIKSAEEESNVILLHIKHNPATIINHGIVQNLMIIENFQFSKDDNLNILVLRYCFKIYSIKKIVKQYFKFLNDFNFSDTDLQKNDIYTKYHVILNHKLENCFKIQIAKECAEKLEGTFECFLNMERKKFVNDIRLLSQDILRDHLIDFNILESHFLSQFLQTTNLQMNMPEEYCEEIGKFLSSYINVREKIHKNVFKFIGKYYWVLYNKHCYLYRKIISNNNPGYAITTEYLNFIEQKFKDLFKTSIIEHDIDIIREFLEIEKIYNICDHLFFHKIEDYFLTLANLLFFKRNI